MKAYSLDLRKCVLAMCDAGHVVAARDFAGGCEAGVDDVTELCDDDQIIEQCCGLFLGRVEALQLGLFLFAALGDLGDLPQSWVALCGRATRGEDADLITSADGALG